jgi:WD40 repeat protein
VGVVVFSTWTGDSVAGLIEAVGEGGESLVDALAEAAARAGGDLYLILDQFEEYFLYHPSRGPFAQQLAEVVQRPGLRVNVLIGMREDSLARLDALKASIPNLLANRLRLERLDRTAGEAAIAGPIDRYNSLVAPEDRVRVEPELLEAVLDEVTAGRVEFGASGRGVVVGTADESRIEAPYLQLVLARLWDVEMARGSRTLTLATLRELGGAERIVESHLERAMAELSPREKGAAAAMYNFLVTPSGTKIAHGVRDLAGYASVAEDEATGVLQRLTAERIVRASSSNGPSTTQYEIFHDVLADAVLAWRTRFEGERRLAEERVRHERRQRRLVAIGAAALLGLAVMAAIAVYAFAQRSNARHQAKVARIAQVRAEDSTLEEKRQRNRAEEKTAELRRQGKELRRQTARAQRGEQRFKKEAQRASRAEARESRRAREAVAANAKAQRSAKRERAANRLAQRRQRQAERAERRTARQKEIIRARQLEAVARALLASNLVSSVKTSLAAVAAYGKTGLNPPETIETTLRDGLLRLRLKAVLPGGGAVRVARFSPDGSRVLVAGKGGARLYDRSHGLSVRRLLPSSDIADGAFSPDGRLVAGAGMGTDHTAHVWDVETGAQLFALEHKGEVLSVAFSPDGRLIATGSADGNARLWSVAGGLPLGDAFQHAAGRSRGDDVEMVSFSPDSRRLLTVGGNRFARVFDVARGEELYALDNEALLNVASFSHDGKLIATGGANDDSRVRIWRPSVSTVRPDYTLRGTGRINDLVFSLDDTHLATAGGNDTTARVWDLAERSSIGVITAHRSGVTAIAFSPDGRSVITSGRDGNAYISQSIRGSTQASLLGHREPINAVAYTRDGRIVATASSDGTVRLWDARVAQSGGLAEDDVREIGSHQLPPNARRGPDVAFSPDGRRILSAGADGTARLWGPGNTVRVLPHDGPVNSGSFSRDGRTVVTASDDEKARVWRVADGRLLRTLDHGAPVNVARLAPGGRTVVTAGRDGAVRLWNLGTGRTIGRLEHSATVTAAEFSRNGRFIVTASGDRTATVWRLSDHRTLTLRGHTDAIVAAVFSPRGDRVATASADGTARIWNARTGASLEPLAGHTGALTSLAFNQAGSLLATASADSEARIWNARSGEEVDVLRIHSGPVNDVAFSADDRWLATAGPISVGIWKTSKRGSWPPEPVYLVRGAPARLDTLAFSPRGWRIVTGWRGGGVRTYNCRLCGRVPQLAAIARARLAEIARPKG